MFKLSTLLFVPVAAFVASNSFASFEEENLSPNLKAKDIIISGKSTASQIRNQLESGSSTFSHLRLKGPLKEKCLEQLNRSLPTITVSEFTAQHGAISENNLPSILSNLEANPNLTRMNLSNNELTEDAVETILYFVSIKPSLKTLELENGKLDGCSLKKIWNEIKDNSSLTRLNLSGNPFIKVKISSIEKALIKNQTLTTIDLSGCNLKYYTGILGTALSKNITVTELDLSSNNINDDALNAFFMGVSQNHSLKKLDLSKNKITGYREQSNNNIKAYSEKYSTEVKTNEDKAKKQIERNEEIDWFTLSLQHHSSLQTLLLSENRIELKGIKKITNALVNCRFLGLLDLSANKILSEEAEHIDYLLMENPYIKVNIDDNLIPENVVSSLEKMYPSQIVHHSEV